MGKPSVAVLLPAYNEEDGLGPVIEDFRKALPDARIVVCDNNSSDKTSEVALAAGAELYTQPLPGKGHAMRRLFPIITAPAMPLATSCSHGPWAQRSESILPTFSQATAFSRAGLCAVSR